jgi:hypothetical protein
MRPREARRGTMRKVGRLSVSLSVIAWGATIRIAAQDFPPHDPRLLAPDKAKTSYSFPVRPGGKEFRFKVQLDDASMVTGVSVFREGESSPFQTLAMCGHNLPFQLLKEVDADRVLIKHADLNFDGLEDMELLQYYIPHLDKSLYCTYLWNSKTERFVYSPEISDIGDPVPHSEDRTLTSHEDWQGGDYQDGTYRWNGGKLELIEQDGLYGNPDNTKCGFTYTCRRLIDGKLVSTLEKLVCSKEEMDKLPDCPTASAAAPLPAKPKSSP